MRILWSFAFACLGVLMTLPLAHAQSNAPFVLSADRADWAEIAPHVSALIDPAGTITQTDLQDAAFASLANNSADFGYTSDTIWLQLDIENATAITNWRLAVVENFFPLYEVWLRGPSGAFERVDFSTNKTDYRTRSVDYPQLTTAMVLPANNTSTMFLRFRSGGSSEISWRIMSADAFSEYAAQRTAKNFVYYGMVTILIVGAALATLATRRAVFAGYGLYMLFGLLFVMHGDGTTFQYLWPGQPDWNNYASVPIGAGLIISASAFARLFLRTDLHHPILHKLLWGATLIAVVLLAASVALDTQPIKKLLVIMALATTCLLAISGFVAARTRFREVRFYVIAWTGAVLASFLMTLQHWFGVEISQELQFDSIRMVLVVDAVLMGLAVLDRINQIRQSRQSALESSLLQAQRSLDLTRRLEDLEDQVTGAEALLQHNKESLTKIAHDLRQPLTALRLNMRNLSHGDASSDTLADAERTVRYLESLLIDQLSAKDPRPADDAPSTSTIGEVLADVHTMFETDAREKGLRFSVVSTDYPLPSNVPRLAVMRMLSNIVANAVQATDQGGLVLGFRHGTTPRIELHDTGSGLPAELFHDVVNRRSTQVSSTGDGFGLGLAITSELAHTHGFGFSMRHRAHGGTVLSLSLPRV